MPYRLLLPLLFAVFTALLGIGIIVPVMPVFATSLGASGLALGFIIASFSITRGVCQPVVGILSDRWGRKGFMLAGLLVFGTVGLLIPLATSVENLVLIRALHGVGSAMIVPVAMAYVSDLAPMGEEGRYMGLLNSAIFAGIGSGPLLGGIFTDLWGMAAAFHAMAALSFLALVLVLLQVPAMAVDPERAGNGDGLFTAMAKMLASRRTSGLLLARLATMIIMVPTMAFLPLFMTQAFAASAVQIGVVISVRTLINAVLQGVGGRLADRHDKPTLLRIGCLLMSGVMILIPLAGNFWSLLLLFVVLGLAEAIIWPTLGALATEEGRKYGQGTMMGVYNLAMSGGVLTGALAAGIATDWLGIKWSFPLIGIVVLGLTMFAIGTIAAHRQQPAVAGS
ncbi:MFS transporter [Desulfurivibrio alkaliphilus]|uniref:Major facilitator superfamily MFS_1 n=1 Tax=Desulfurivibrio alkaliphilus (strain DSM 19089 / UNIQEM U267 / AHT2) TaxID=589865 RepID=D6Z1L7_DESAT|nr:MFS transporter [Desulfurivibrio alkaliphilus]ADH85442.1 major facilitator superfamily MFS_1 [Desulfurivibrio alkaliphilus AHT 2]